MATITNTATIEGSQNGQQGGLTSNTVTWNVVEPLLGTFTKAPDNVDIVPGENTTVTLSYTNDGTADTTNITIRDVLDPNLTFVPGSVQVNGTPLDQSDYTYVGGVLTINPNVSVGAGETLTITFQVTA